MSSCEESKVQSNSLSPSKAAIYSSLLGPYPGGFWYDFLLSASSYDFSDLLEQFMSSHSDN